MSLGTDIEKHSELFFTILKKDDAAYIGLLESLNKTGNQHLADNLEKSTLEKKDLAQKENVWYEVPIASKFYTGREKEMSYIDECWNEHVEKKSITFVAITGLGGLGKSELAKNYAKKFYSEHGKFCIWLNAESTPSLLASVHGVATKIGVSLKDDSGKEKDLYTLLQNVYNSMVNKNCLIVLDNVTTFDDPIFQALIELELNLSPDDLRPFIILTSRYRAVQAHFGQISKHIELDVLSEESAVRYFNQALLLKDDDENVNSQIKSICERLQYFPLAMSQAVAFIAEEKNTSSVENAIATYRDLIEKQSDVVLTHALPMHESAKTTNITWKVTLDKIGMIPEVGTLAIHIINIISFFSPDNISMNFLVDLLKETPEIIINSMSTLFETGAKIDNKIEAFKLLHNYSMYKMSYSDNNDFRFSIHRLVQEIIRNNLKQENLWTDNLENLLTIMYKSLEGHIVENAELSNKAGKMQIPLNQMDHVVSVWQYSTQNRQIFENHHKLTFEIYYKYFSNGRYSEAYDFCCKALQTMEELLGKDHRSTLWMRFRKGQILRERGEYDESYKELLELHEKQKQLFGESDNDTLYTANTLGGVLWRQKRYPEAMSCFKNAFDFRQKIYGDEHQETLFIKMNIANVLNDEGKHEEALSIYNELLAVREKLFGEKHHQTLMTKHNIGVTKFNLGQYSDALSILEQVLNGRQEELEIDHPYTLTTKYWIACSLRKLEQFEEAKTIASEVYEKRKEKLGKNHPHTVMAQQELDGDTV